MCGGCAECASVSGELCGTRYAPLRPTVPLRYNRMLRKSIFCAVSVVSMEVWAVHVCVCVVCELIAFIRHTWIYYYYYYYYYEFSLVKTQSNNAGRRVVWRGLVANVFYSASNISVQL